MFIEKEYPAITHFIKSKKSRNGVYLGCLLKKDKCDICIKYKKWLESKKLGVVKLCKNCSKYKRYYAEKWFYLMLNPEKVQDKKWFSVVKEPIKKRGLCRYCIAFESYKLYTNVEKICSHYDPIDIVFYSGYIARKVSRKILKYTVEKNGYEEEIFSTIYKDRFSISLPRLHRASPLQTVMDIGEFGDSKNKKGSAVLRTKPEKTQQQDVIFNIHNNTIYKKAGLFAYLNIISYTRTKLLKLFQIARKLRPSIKVVRIYNDSISFDHNVKLVELNKLKSKNNPIPKILSEIKNEEIHNYESTNSILYNFFKDKLCNKYTKSKLNTFYAEVNENSPNYFYDQFNNPVDLINSSMCVFAFAGLGKSYFVSRRIIPKLKKMNKSFLIVSTTLENSKYWVEYGGTGKAINHYIKSCDVLLQENLGKYDYIIIDEVSQLTMEIISKLENIKKLLGTKFILIGDPMQCTGIDNIPYLNTFIIHRLCDFNIVKIKFHTKGRYKDRKYYDFLCNVLKFDNKDERLKYVQECIETVNEIKGKNPFLITWTNASKIPLEKKYNYKVKTIHITQGKTIESNLYVYIDEIKDKRILYTALSRVRDFQFIKLLTLKREEPKGVKMSF